MIRLLVFSIAATLWACKSPPASPSPDTQPVPAAADSTPSTPPSPRAPEEPLLDYLEMVTAGADVSRPLPLIVAVHGLGDRPENFVRWLKGLPFPARVIAPRAPTPYGRGYSWFPVERPFEALESRDRAAIADASQRLAQLIRHLPSAHPTIGKPLVLGFSQGGVLSFELAVRSPALIGAALPIAGTWAGARVGAHRGPIAPIFGFHGVADRRIPFGLAEGAVAQLATQGRKATLRPYPDVRHTMTADMRRDIFQQLFRLTR